MDSFFLSLRQRSRVLWGVSILVALVLLYQVSYLHGVDKLADAGGFSEFFGKTLGLGGWSVYVSGVLEIGGPLLMLHWRTAFWGGLFVAVNMAVASAVVYQMGNVPTETLVYLGMGVVVMWMMRPGFLRTRPPITTVRA